MTHTSSSTAAEIRRRLLVLQQERRYLEYAVETFDCDGVVYPDQCTKIRTELTGIREHLDELNEIVNRDIAQLQLSVLPMYLIECVGKIFIDIEVYLRIANGKSVSQIEKTVQKKHAILKQLKDVLHRYDELVQHGLPQMPRTTISPSHAKTEAWIRQIAVYLETILALEPTLQEVHHEFTSSGNLDYGSCERAMRVLTTAQTTGEHLQSLVDSATIHASSGHEIPLAVATRQFVSLVKDVARTIDVFSPHPPSLKQRQDIENGVSDILSLLAAMHQQFDDLSDQLGILPPKNASGAGKVIPFPGAKAHESSTTSTTSLFCDDCGAANREKAQFCAVCGASLSSLSNRSGSVTTQGAKSVHSHLAKQSLLAQRYCILETRGSGGFGAVYKAADTKFGNRLIAIKEMHQHGFVDEDERDKAVDAFQREALLLSHLHHPNLPRVHDAFSEGGRSYIVMDFLEGQTLDEAMDHFQKGTKLSVEQTLALAYRLCDVLDYLHTRNPPIIFRDLKPSNIILTPRGQVYLVDFGIARLFKPRQSRDTEALGSWGFASPEQYGKAQTDAKSDIYSLAVIIHCVLTGIDPSQSANPFVFESVVDASRPATQSIQRVLETMLLIDATKRRPASMNEVRTEIEQLAMHYSPKSLLSIVL